MLAKHHPDYDGQFPERFNWSLLTSHKLTDVAEQLCRLITSDLLTADRTNTPGCRIALSILASVGDVD